MRRLFFVVLFCVFTIVGFAQCLNTVSVGSGKELVAPVTAGATASVVYMKPSEYIPVYGMVIGYQYWITSTVTTDYITIRSGTFDGPVVARGVQPLNFTPSASGNYFVHVNTDAACGTTFTAYRNVDVTLTVRTSTPSGCINRDSLGTLTAPAAVNGTSTASCMIAGRFAPMSNVVSGNMYTITSAVATDYITVRSGTYTGPVVAVGVQPLTFTAPTGGRYYVHLNTNADCGTQQTCRQVTVTRIYPPCTGTPALGNAVTSNAGPVCGSTTLNLSVTTPPAAGNIDYQWEVSTTGAAGPFSPIAGQTDVTATITGQSQTSWYRLTATCGSTGQSGYSSAVQVTQQTAANCYCTPSYQYSNQYGYINSVQLGTIKNVTGQNAAAPNNYYSYLSTPAANQTTGLLQGSSQTITVDRFVNSPVSAWIDFNGDGDFDDPGETLGRAAGSFSSSSTSFPFTVPVTAAVGPTRLRVRASYGVDMPGPCGLLPSYGETEDYIVTIVTPCTGTPMVGNAITSNTGPVCGSTTFNLSVSSPLRSIDITQQWEVSTTGAAGPFSPIAGQTDVTATITGQSQSSWYRLVSRCNSTGQSGYSTPVQVTQQAAANCYCTPEIGYDNSYGYINSVQLGTINNVSGQNVVPPQGQRTFYFSYVNTPAANQTTNLPQASSQTITIDVSGSLGGNKGTNSVAAWIDFNGDGDFYDVGEQLGTAANLPDGNLSFTFSVPANAVLGATRLRIREGLVYGSDPFTSPRPVTDPCNFIRTYGESEDYLVTITEPCTGTNITVYRDADGDTYGNPAVTLSVCSAAALPDGYVADNTDCNDADGGIHASFPFYVDADGDGYGAGSAVNVCAANATVPSAGYALNNTDCDDGDNTKWQSAMLYIDSDGDGYDNGTTSVCYGASIPQGYSNNTMGHDCDDADAAISAPYTRYRDSDGDGFGDPANSITVCPNTTAPSGYVTDNTDCDDTKMLFADADGDGYAGTTLVACGGLPTPGTDCDDNNPAIHDPKIYYRDNDRDGFGNFKEYVTVCSNTAPSGYVDNRGDCNDFDATIYPGAPELCDGKDNNCNGQTDEGFEDVIYYLDADGDGFGNPALSTVAKCTAPDGYVADNTDCNDADAGIHAPVQYYIDADGDGYGSAAVALVCSSTPPSGYTTNNTDCNDADATVHSSFSFYADNDGDGYGAGALITVCGVNAGTPPSGYALNGTDCNDNDASVWRTGTFYRDGDGDGYTVGSGETVCYGTATPAGYATTRSGVDDCNDADATITVALTWYKDADGDGYSDGTTVTQCTPPAGYKLVAQLVSTSVDCNDADRTVYPGAPELCDGKDNNCNGQVDEGCNALAVSSLTLVNATSNGDITNISDGMIIDLSTIPGKAINIRANTVPAKTGSVKFVLSGTQAKNVTENILPYALFGDNGKGDYNNWTPKVGSYTLTATPYTKSGAKGTAGTRITISFTVVDNPSSTLSGLTLINANSDKDIGPLVNGQVIDLSLTPGINIRADVASGASVGSVRFSLNSTLNYKTENQAPFTIAGDNEKGDYYKWNIASGTYTVQATPYAKDNAKGFASVPITVTFTIIRSGTATKTAQLDVKEKKTTPSVAGTIYPNPTTGFFTLQFQSDREEKADLLIVDRKGVVVERRQKLLAKGAQTLSFNLSSKAAGLYSLQVQTASGKQSFRVVLVH